MHYEVKFKGSKFEKESAALQECMNYLDAKRRRGLIEIAQDCQTVREVYQTARLACVMTGIRGYWPIRAVARFMLQAKYPGKFLLLAK